MNEVSATLEKYQFDNLVVLKRRLATVEFAEEHYYRAVDYPEHEHEQAYFMLTDNCVYRERLGRKTFYHPPNTVLWRPAAISHADGMAQKNGRSFSVYIKNELLEKFSDYGKVPAEFSEKNSRLVVLAHRLRNEFRNWTRGSDLIAEGLVLEMLGYATRRSLQSEKKPPAWMIRIVDKLESEFLETHTNLKLAEEAGIHPVHLARTFRKYNGKSVGTFLKQKRVQHAMQLIMQQDLSLADIASASGFQDQSQFTRAFKDIAGITPGVFRREVKRSRQ